LNGALTDPAAGDRLGICLLDLDDFTALSDSLGPDSADRLLYAVGQRLRAVATNDQYYLAHLGGSQFALVVEYTSSVEDAVKAAEQAMRALSHPYHLAGHELGITARGGVIERHCTQASPVGAHRIPPP